MKLLKIVGEIDTHTFEVDDVTNSSCGTDHILFVCNKRVFTFGDNGYSQLGRGLEEDSSLEPRKTFDIPKPIVQVSGGETHSLALDEEGKIWSWGGTALIRGRHGPASTPMKLIRGVEDQIVFTSISCGSRHSLAVDRLGRAFAWGMNGSGQLGFPSADAEEYLRPTVVPLPTGVFVLSVASGESHSLLLSYDLRVFGTGKSPCNGSDLDSNQFEPIIGLCKRRETDPVIQIHSGHNHSLVLTNEKRIFAFGDGSCGKLGIGTEKDSFEPIEIEFDKQNFTGASKLFCGRNISIIVDVNNQIWIFGLKQDLKHLILDKEEDIFAQKSLRAPNTVALPLMYSVPVLSDVFKNSTPPRILNVFALPRFTVFLFDLDKSLTSFFSLPTFPNRSNSLLLQDSSNYKLAMLSNLLLKEEQKNKNLKFELEKERSEAKLWRELMSRKSHDEAEARQVLEKLSPDDFRSPHLKKLVNMIGNLHGRILELEKQLNENQ